MVTCNDFYAKFEEVGNYCNKSENTAKQIEKYIEYRKKHKLESYEINRCALYPFQMIENKEVLHSESLKELKKVIRKKGGRNITRRISIEIINKVNNLVDVPYRIKEIPDVRRKMGEFEHDIGEISYEAKEMFNNFKSEINAKTNNEALSMLLEYSHNNNVIDSIKAEIESRKEAKKDIEIISEN